MAAFARSRLCVQDVASRVALRGVDAHSYLGGLGLVAVRPGRTLGGDGDGVISASAVSGER